MEEQGRLRRPNGIEIAWRRVPGRVPTVVFLHGFASDMTGAKAEALTEFCSTHGQAILRFDYSGHGSSGGLFTDGIISSWLADAVAAIDELTWGPVVLVGSSMGGWLGLLVARQRSTRVKALVGIAAAPDFTEMLLWPGLSHEQQSKIMENGVIELPSSYGPPLSITRALIEDGRKHLVLKGNITLSCPVRLFHGQQDRDVPWDIALRLSENIAHHNVHVTLIKDGDHRLSRPVDLELLKAALVPLLREDRP